MVACECNICIHTVCVLCILCVVCCARLQNRENTEFAVAVFSFWNIFSNCIELTNLDDLGTITARETDIPR